MDTLDSESEEGEETEKVVETDKVEQQVSVAMAIAQAHLKDAAGKEKFSALSKHTSFDRFDVPLIESTHVLSMRDS